MSSLDALLVRQALAQGTVVQVGSDSPVAIRLRYVGKGSVTSVTVTTATDIVTISTEGTKTYAFATFTTIGAVVDAINKDGIFEAKILDELRSAASASRLLTGAITAGTDTNGVRVWDVRLDTSTALRFVATITAHRDFDQPKRRVRLQEFVYNATLGAAGANNVEVWLRRGTVETRVFAGASASAAVTTVNFASGRGSITGREGDELVVILKDGTSIADAPANFLRAIGEIY